MERELTAAWEAVREDPAKLDQFGSQLGGARVADPVESRTFPDEQADDCLLQVRHLGGSSSTSAGAGRAQPPNNADIFKRWASNFEQHCAMIDVIKRMLESGTATARNKAVSL
eukprot:9186569-Alexandrium_andersonii.AAC.1